VVASAPPVGFKQQTQGVAFKRQVVIGERYIADLCAPSVGLVVEVDGGVHSGTRSADRRRDEMATAARVPGSARGAAELIGQFLLTDSRNCDDADLMRIFAEMIRER
jgi:hypothetical protein